LSTDFYLSSPNLCLSAGVIDAILPNTGKKITIFPASFRIRRSGNVFFVHSVFILSIYTPVFAARLSVLHKNIPFLRIPSIDGRLSFCYHNHTTHSKQGMFRKGGIHMNWAAILWLVLTVILLITEAATVTVVSLWFAAGALAAMAMALAGGSIWLQVLTFLVVSAAALTALRPLVRKYLTPKLTATNIDSLIGSIGIVTAAIDNIAASGQIKLNGMEWTARSSSGELIETGTKVRVDKIEGVKVFVSPVEVPANI
jgi:membrane protein implicated in regulation of membrane protease activity